MNASSRQAVEERPGRAASLPSLFAGASRWSRRLFCLTLVGVIAALLCLPFIRFVSCVCSDEGIFLRAGELMLDGSKPYVDFFEFLPPGGFLITAGWLAIAGVSMLSARVLTILTIVGIVCFTYLACRQASKHPIYAVLFSLGWLVMSLGPWTQISHHWFTTLFSMVVAWTTLASIETPRRWLRGPLLGGIAAGAAAMITPTQGVLVMLAGASAFGNLRRYWVEMLAYAFGAALVPIVLFAYVAAYGGLAQAFDDVILFPATRYARTSWVPYGFEAGWQNFPLKYLFPVAAVVAIAVCVRNRHAWREDRLLRSCAAFAMAGIVAILPRPGIYHIAFVAPLFLPLLAHCANRLVRPWRAGYRYATAGLAICFCLPSIVSFLMKAEMAITAAVVGMPRGNVTILWGEDGARKLAAWIATTPKEDGYFFYPRDSLISFLTARRHVSKYDFFFPNYTLPSQYQEACLSVLQRASWVVIDRNWTDLGDLTATNPGLPNTLPEETKRFEQALEKGFEFVAQHGPYEVRHRIEPIDENLCSGIAE
jgi:hypothetical protein